MISIKNITKSFGNLQVLKGINLEIGNSEVVSIVDLAVLERPRCYKLWEL